MERCIDADELKKCSFVIAYKDERHMTQYGEFVEVVRCEDCEHYKQSEADTDRKMCWRKDVDGVPVCYDFYPTDFCSYGERREDG